MEIESLIARSLQVLIALGGAYLIATWFVLVVWTFRDIESRSRNVVTQVFSTLLSVFFWIPGVLLYMLLRPKETLDEAYQKSLEEEYLLQDLQELPLCPSCHHFVHDDWQICPHCNTQLREPCDHCGHLVDLRWDTCPYCGEEQHEREPAKPEIDKEAAKEGWVDPEQIERRLRAEQARRTQQNTTAHALPAATAVDRHTVSPAAASALDAGSENTTTLHITPSETTSDPVAVSSDSGQSETPRVPDSFRLPTNRGD